MPYIKKEPIKILFPEGSSLSARQALNVIGNEGYIIDICDPNPFCICRFSKYYNKFYKCPQIGKDPIGYLNFIIELLKNNNYDVLLPIHENSYLFSRMKKIIAEYTNIAISSFESFSIVQSKTKFMKLLKKLNIPHPFSKFINSLSELEYLKSFPYYIKLEYGTAGHGTWYIGNENNMNSLIKYIEQQNEIFNAGEEILIQKAVSGNLCVIQSVFNEGNLVCAHSYKLLFEGIGGSASARIGVNHPVVLEYLIKIGKYLNWHGSLMLDYIYDEKNKIPHFIEANPRIGETMNSTLSGANIAKLLIDLSISSLNKIKVNNIYGVKTHSLLAILLGVACKSKKRIKIIAEVLKALFKKGIYSDSIEDLTNMKLDFKSVIPLIIIIIQLLIKPSSVNKISSKAIENYSINNKVVKIIENMNLE